MLKGPWPFTVLGFVTAVITAVFEPVDDVQVDHVATVVPVIVGAPVSAVCVPMEKVLGTVIERMPLVI